MPDILSGESKVKCLKLCVRLVVCRRSNYPHSSRLAKNLVIRVEGDFMVNADSVIIYGSSQCLTATSQARVDTDWLLKTLDLIVCAPLPHHLKCVPSFPQSCRVVA